MKHATRSIGIDGLKVKVSVQLNVAFVATWLTYIHLHAKCRE